MKNKILVAYKFVLVLLMLGLLITGIILHRNYEKALINRLSIELSSASNSNIFQFQNWLSVIFLKVILFLKTD